MAEYKLTYTRFDWVGSVAAEHSLPQAEPPKHPAVQDGRQTPLKPPPRPTGGDVMMTDVVMDDVGDAGGRGISVICSSMR